MIVSWSTADLQKKTIPMYLCKEKEKTNETKQSKTKKTNQNKQTNKQTNQSSFYYLNYSWS